MKKFGAIFIIIFPFIAYSQRLHLNLFGGFASYQGDLQDKSFDPNQTNGALGAGLTYDLTNHLSLRSGFMYGKVGANDNLDRPNLQSRNLSFQSKILETNLLFEYSLFDLNKHKISPYIFSGLGVYHFNPYAYDSLGNQIYLKPLSTEGQGLAQYPDRKPYHLTQFNIPFGAGIKMRISENLVLGYEIGLRKLFTDYLDDVSTTYVDGSALALARGSKAVEMAFRGGEIKDASASYPLDGTIRGGASRKDWYYFQGITLSIGLNNGKGGRGKSGELVCPSKVY